MTETKDKIFDKLVKITDSNRVIADKKVLKNYSQESFNLPKTTGLLFNTTPDYVVKPTSSKEISKIIKLACRESLPVIGKGTASWSLGGAVPTQGGIILDMSLMNNILNVDEDNLEIEVEAGAAWKKVYNVAYEDNLTIGTYPHIGVNSSVGGWLSTERIGIGNYKYGSVRSNIRNMEVVLPEGQIINTGFNKVLGNSAGYNLNGLFLGSEGTLGIITKVTLKAYPAKDIIKPVAIEFENLKAAYATLKSLARSKIVPLNILFSDENHPRILNHLGGDTVRKNTILNVTLEGSKESIGYDMAVLEDIVKNKGGTFTSEEVAKKIWKDRFFDYEETVTGRGMGMGNIIFPISEFNKVSDQVYELIRKMKMDASIFGIMGDRNSVVLTCIFVYNENKSKRISNLAFVKKLGDIAFAHDGRPLGIGLYFASNLPKFRGKAAEVMYDIKTAFDPYDILNPGKLVEGVSRYGTPVPKHITNITLNALAGTKRVLPKDKVSGPEKKKATSKAKELPEKPKNKK